MPATQPFSALERLKEWLTRTEMDEKAFVIPTSRYGGEIHDGDYGDPHRDTRPDFVKQDSEGWRKLVRLD